MESWVYFGVFTLTSDNEVSDEVEIKWGYYSSPGVPATSINGNSLLNINGDSGWLCDATITVTEAESESASSSGSGSGSGSDSKSKSFPTLLVVGGVLVVAGAAAYFLVL